MVLFDGYIFFVFRLKHFLFAVIVIYAVSITFHFSHLQVGTSSVRCMSKGFNAPHKVRVVALNFRARIAEGVVRIFL